VTDLKALIIFAQVARVVDTDAQGKMVVLREGNNGFTCMPGNLRVVGEPPMYEITSIFGLITYSDRGQLCRAISVDV
jgi:hypothetical protein